MVEHETGSRILSPTLELIPSEMNEERFEKMNYRKTNYEKVQTMLWLVKIDTRLQEGLWGFK